LKGVCALYKKEADLQESHIFPKFVIKHTKKTGSQYLRRIVEPDKRNQDGLKLHLLSFEAEQEFSIREKWFAENIFVPYLKGKQSLNYNENLYYFGISFLWRVLVTEIRTDPKIDKFWYYSKIQKVEKEWRNYLKNGELPEIFHNINILMTDRILSHNSDLEGVDYYLTRALDGTIVDNRSHTFLLVYGKFNRFIFWSVVKSPNLEDELYDVEINPKGGTIEIPQGLKFDPLFSFITNRLKEINKHPLPSESQQNKIEQEIMKDPEKFWKSDVGQSLYNDKFNLDK